MKGENSHNSIGWDAWKNSSVPTDRFGPLRRRLESTSTRKYGYRKRRLLGAIPPQDTVQECGVESDKVICSKRDKIQEYVENQGYPHKGPFSKGIFSYCKDAGTCCALCKLHIHKELKFACYTHRGLAWHEETSQWERIHPTYMNDGLIYNITQYI